MVKVKKNQKTNQKNINKNVFRFLTIFLLLCSLALGILFSTWRFSKDYKLGNDFRGYYSALVSVDNVNNEKKANNQPNGDAKEAAKVLEQRLNPMGTNQIIIETAGLNYLKVLSPIEAYKNKIVFQNQIQRKGGAILLNEEYKDLQFKDQERTGINDFFSSAKSTSITTARGKNPAVSFELKGSNFSSLFKAEEGQTSAKLKMSVLIDADGFYNDIRNFYNLVEADKNEEKVNLYFEQIIEPFRNIYNNSETSDNAKKILADFFKGRYTITTSGNNKSYSYVNLLDKNFERKTFLDHFSDFEFLSDTSGYVYDPNAKTDDFKEGGKYAEEVIGYSISSGNDRSTKLGKVNELFNEFNPVMAKFLNTNANSLNKKIYNSLTNYFLFDGTASNSGRLNEASTSVNGAYGYIKDNHFITEYPKDPESKAKMGASVFNASTKGFVFTVNEISEISGSITSLMLSFAIIFMGVIALALMIYIAFLYRVLGIFMIAIILAITGLTLLSTTWFGLTLGPETIIGIILIIALNLEIFVLIFENIKYNIFNKQRGVKTSFNISIKENLGIAIDVIVALIVPSICLFWITSNALQSFAIIISMGMAFSILLTVLFAVILFKMLINTNIFNNNLWLFALNTSFAKNGRPVLNYKIYTLKNKIQKLDYATINDKKIEVLERQKSSLNDSVHSLSSKSQKATLKKIEKIEKKLLNLKSFKIDSKDIDKRKALQAKLATLETKLAQKEQKHEELHVLKAEKIKEKLNKKINKKITKIKTKISKLDQEKYITKINKLNLAIEELNYVLNDNTETIIEQESEIVTSTKEKLKVKTYEKVIKHGSKLLAFILIILTSIAALVGGLWGPNYDATFGNRTEYTIWGSNIDEFYQNIEAVSNKDEPNNELINIAKNTVENFNDFENENPTLEPSSSKRQLKKTQLVSNFIDTVFLNKEYVNYLANITNAITTYVNHNHSVSYGSKFEYNSKTSDEENYPWISLSVATTNSEQSSIAKNVFQRMGINITNAREDRGFISKRIRPATMLWMSFQMLWTVLAIILGLLIYILIRFKWTYYIAMIVAIILTPAITLGAIVALQIPLGMSSLISIVASISFVCMALFIIFGKARSLIVSKDEKSLNEYFKKEIEYSYNTKSEKKRIKDELFLIKADLKLALKSKDLTVKEKRELYAQFSKTKQEKYLAFKDIRKENKIKISRVAKENNYLKEVMVQTFRFGVKRTYLIGSVYIAVALLLAMTLSPLLAFGISLIIGILSSALVVLFVAIPIWIGLEQLRIRNHLSRKHFINNLKVSGEEQIIEGIND